MGKQGRKVGQRHVRIRKEGRIYKGVDPEMGKQAWARPIYMAKAFKSG
jgi:hypothetical protein